MSTLNEITYSVLSPVKPYLTGDTRLTIEQVQYDIKINRAVLIRNELNKNRSKDPGIIQSLGCVPIKAVDSAECCELKSGCYIMRTVDPIPGAIETHNKPQITRIGPIDLSKKGYSFITYTQAQFAGNNKYTKNSIYTFLLNGYVYIVSNNPNIYSQEYINIQGIFEDPTEVSKYKCDIDSDKKCYDEDSPYPIKDWMVSYLITILQEKYLKIYNIMPKDKSNDSTDQITDK